ncbi:response regulator [Natrinema thermotolerans]
MSEYSIWWIDDTPERKGTHSDVLEEQSESISVEFSGPEEATQDLSSGDTPRFDLVLIDWMLHEHGNFFGKGLTMAGTVRENLPEIPIYAFTGGSLSDLRTPASQEHFQATFSVDDLISEDGVKNLEDDLQDFALIESVRGDSLEDLLGVLNPPEDVIEELEGVTPREFNSGLKEDQTQDGGSRIEFADWVRHRFLETPGPLWNKVWTATKLGLEVEAFNNYKQMLYETEYGDFTYDGVFSHRKETLWWSSELIGAIVELSQRQDKPVSEISRAAPDLFGARGEEIAHCRLCGDDFPETVAAGEKGENAKYPVHFRCSDIHHSREGAFEDYRVAHNLEE